MAFRAPNLWRGRAHHLDAEAYLRSHNAYPYLQRTQDLLITGPTQTNVNDMFVLAVGSNGAVR